MTARVRLSYRSNSNKDGPPPPVTTQSLLGKRFCSLSSLVSTEGNQLPLALCIFLFTTGHETRPIRQLWAQTDDQDPHPSDYRLSILAMGARFALTIREERERVGRPDDNPDGLVLEAWAQGFMVGTLVFMAAITIANMRRRALLHKLILAEVSI